MLVYFVLMKDICQEIYLHVLYKWKNLGKAYYYLRRTFVRTDNFISKQMLLSKVNRCFYQKDNLFLNRCFYQNTIKIEYELRNSLFHSKIFISNWLDSIVVYELWNLGKAHNYLRRTFVRKDICISKQKPFKKQSIYEWRISLFHFTF